MGPSMDLLTNHQVETTHLTLHKTLDLVTETTATPAAMTCTTRTADKATTGTTTGTEVTSRTSDMNKEIQTTKTGMIITKIEIGLTTEGDQTNTNTTETNTRHKSSLNCQTKI